MSMTENTLLPPVSEDTSLSNQKRLTKMGILKQKMKDEPVIFVCLTLAALCGGLVSHVRGDSFMSQRMMRLRVAFQFGAITSMGGYVYARTCRSFGLDPMDFKTTLLEGETPLLFRKLEESDRLAREKHAAALAAAAAEEDLKMPALENSNSEKLQ